MILQAMDSPSDRLVMEALLCKLACRRVRRRIVDTRSRTRKKRDANDKRDRSYGVKWFWSLRPAVFKRAFRMDRQAFGKLYKLVYGDMLGEVGKAVNSSGSAVSPLVKLAVTLRWLAGGSHIDICGLFGLGPGSFYSQRGPLWPTIEILNVRLSSSMVFDTSPEACKKAAQGFARYYTMLFLYFFSNSNAYFSMPCLRFSKGHLKHCVCAVDGVVIRTRAPHLKELPGAVKDLRAYRNRKGCFGIIGMAGCDSECRFLFMTAKHSGTGTVVSYNCLVPFHFVDDCRIILYCYQGQLMTSLLLSRAQVGRSFLATASRRPSALPWLFHTNTMG